MKSSFFVRLIAMTCLSFVLATGLRMLDLGSTLAAVACQGQDYYFIGTDVKKTTVAGISSDISTTNPPALCGASYSDSSIWDAIATGDYYNNPCGLAQSGYGRHQGQSSIFVFAQYGYGNCSMVPPIIVVEVPAGNHTYQVVYKRPANANKRRAVMWFDNQRIARSNFDPEVRWGAQPWAFRYASEAHDYGDDVMGTPSVPAYFSNIAIRACKGCSWVTPSGLLLGTSSLRYDWLWDQAYTFHTWTK